MSKACSADIYHRFCMHLENFTFHKKRIFFMITHHYWFHIISQKDDKHHIILKEMINSIRRAKNYKVTWFFDQNYSNW
jgi:hypothetical protein